MHSIERKGSQISLNDGIIRIKPNNKTDRQNTSKTHVYKSNHEKLTRLRQTNLLCGTIACKIRPPYAESMTEQNLCETQFTSTLTNTDQ